MKRLEIPEADLPTDLYEDDVFEKVENTVISLFRSFYSKSLFPL